MAIKVGAENKRQVYLLIGLVVVLVPVLLWNFGVFSSKPAPVTAPKTVANVGAAKPGAPQTTAGGNAAPQAEKLDNSNIDPALHLVRLAEAESILYGGRGRNIFSADSVPFVEEKPLGTGRNTAAVENLPIVPERPTAPKIDLKYFGYVVNKDKTMKAFFSRNDEIFIASPGEIVDHRYKIGNITINNVQITDLNYNNAQTVNFSGARD